MAERNESAKQSTQRGEKRKATTIEILLGIFAGMICAALYVLQDSFADHPWELVTSRVLIGVLTVGICYLARSFLTDLVAGIPHVVARIAAGGAAALAVVLAIAIMVGMIWILVSVFHWLWTNPLF